MPLELKEWKQESEINNMKTRINEENKRIINRYSTCKRGKGIQFVPIYCYVLSDSNNQ